MYLLLLRGGRLGLGLHHERIIEHGRLRSGSLPPFPNLRCLYFGPSGINIVISNNNNHEREQDDERTVRRPLHAC